MNHRNIYETDNIFDIMKFKSKIEPTKQSLQEYFPRWVYNTSHDLGQGLKDKLGKQYKDNVGPKVIENYFPYIHDNKLIHNKSNNEKICNKENNEIICKCCNAQICDIIYDDIVGVNIKGTIFCYSCFHGHHENMRLIELQIKPIIDIWNIFEDYNYLTVKCPLLNIILSNVLFTKEDTFINYSRDGIIIPIIDMEFQLPNTVKVPICLTQEHFIEKSKVRKILDIMFKDTSYIIADYLYGETPNMFKKLIS